MTTALGFHSILSFSNTHTLFACSVCIITRGLVNFFGLLKFNPEHFRTLPQTQNTSTETDSERLVKEQTLSLSRKIFRI